MALHHVTFTVSMIVEAPSPKAAEQLVTSGSLDWGDEYPNGGAIAHRIESLRDIDKAFHDSIPWGGDGCRTVREMLEGK